MGPFNGGTALPRSRDAGLLSPGTPSKSSHNVFRRPPPERDRPLSALRCLIWSLFLGSVIAAGMGGYALGAARSVTAPSITQPGGTPARVLPSGVSAGGSGVSGGSARSQGGPERALSQYEMRRAATAQIPGRPPPAKPPLQKAAAMLALPPCIAGIAGGAGAAGGCGAAFGQPRVALLFLTVGDMPHEALWRSWLQAAEGLVRADCLMAATDSQPGEEQAGGRRSGSGLVSAQPPSSGPNPNPNPDLLAPLPIRVRRACAADSASTDVVARQALFSVYVHSQPGHAGYKEGSPFHGHVIAQRVQTDWGDHSLVEATRFLIRAALEEPLNQRFVLLSESCVPLYSPAATYLQLMGRPKSPVNACNGRDSDLNRERWRDLMGAVGLGIKHWRKSAQWFGLTRAHAELVAADTELLAAFGELCALEKKEQGRAFLNCHSDEHYVPSLLARAGEDNSTDCSGSLTLAEWMVSKYGDAYPRYFMPQEISGDFLEHLRAAEDVCDVAGVNAAVHVAFMRIIVASGASGAVVAARPCGPAPGGQTHSFTHQNPGFTHQNPSFTHQNPSLTPAAPHAPGSALPSQCPLFARKFSPFTADALLGLYQQDGGLGILDGVCNVSDLD